MQVLPEDASAKPAARKTEQVFLSNTYLFELADCKLLEGAIAAEPSKDVAAGEVKVSIILDRTIFHPQGGGQPADVGQLTAKGLPVLKVSMVSLRKDDGAVLHDCVVSKADADAWVAKADAGGIAVHCSVDEMSRRLNARVHSAGHLLDRAVKDLDFKWVPGKGYHFPDGPYVEYVLSDVSRKIDAKKAGDKESMIKQLQEAIDKLVNAGGAVSTEYKGGVRHVEMAGEECPCGGTHVKNIAELLKVEVKTLKAKSGNIRLSYQVAAAA